MTEQLRAVDHDMHRAAVEAGYAPLSDYVADPVRTVDLDLCNSVADLVRGALDEYLRANPISARLRLVQAQKLIGTHIGGGV